MDQSRPEHEYQLDQRPERSTHVPRLPHKIDVYLWAASIAAIFVVDLYVPLGYSLPLLYLGPLLFLWRIGLAWSEPMVAAGLIGLTWLGFFGSTSGDISRALFNRTAASAVFLAAGFLLKHYRTTREKANTLEGALAHRTHDYEQLVTSLPLFIWTANAEGHCTYLSPQWTTVTGGSTAEAIRQQGLAQIHPDDRASMAQAWMESLQRRTIFTKKFRLRCADGAYRWYLARAVPELGPDGLVQQWFGTGHDIDESVRLEQALARKNMRFHTALGDANVGLWDWWPDDNHVVLSDAWKRQLGYEPHELPNDFDEWHRRLHPDDIDRTMATIGRILASGAPRFEIDFRLRHRDGSWRWIVGRGVLMPVESGQPRQYFGVNIDLTNLKQAETHLRASEERYRLMEAGLNDGLWDWNIDTNIAYLSPRWKALLGYEPHELADRFETFTEALHPDDRQQAQQMVHAHLTQQVPYLNEFRLRTKDGTYRWFQSRGQAIRLADGKPIRMVGVLTDITSRKTAETALQASEAHLRLVLATIPTGILMLDPKGHILLANAQAERMFGYAPGALLMKPVQALLPPRTHVTYSSQWPHYMTWLKTAGASDVEPLTGLRIDGAEFPIEIELSRLVLPDGPVILVALADRTERRKAEEATRAQQVLERVFREREALTRNLHDGVLQSMYAVRLGLEHCHGLLNAQPDRAQRALTQHVDDLALLISELRGFMEHSDPDWAKASTLAAGLTSLVRQYQQVTAMHWQLHCPETTASHTSLSADDRRHLLYIAREALSNVVRHAGATACRIELETTADGLRLTIEDNGCGFDRTGHKPSGRGLGNMDARVRQLGGTLTLHSAPAVGTHIIIHLNKKAAHVTA